ncbi:MAG TPA: antibiotic biosynthesis monooxygenase [Streptosporangiaceae bacterium]|nr:antibiotic biosynthesis monooxygenase [Streptosporangiaceae bacterium]
MSISFAAALAGTVLAAVGTGLAIRLCLRKPRADLVAWVIALAGLTVGLAAQAAGYRRGFVPTTFRVTQLGAALVAPLALAWGMAELAAKGLVARFAARLCLAGLFVVVAVILATDVLSARGFTQQWPAPRDHFQYVSLSLLALVAAVVVLTVITTLITTGLRSRHHPAWRGPLVAVALAGVAALATQGLLVKLPANVAYPGLTLVAAVAAWLAASQAAGVNVGQLRAGASGPGGPRSAADPGYGGDDSLDLYRDGYRHFDDSAAFAAYVNSGYDTGGSRAPGESYGGAGERGGAGYGGAGEHGGGAGGGATGYGGAGGSQADGYPGPEDTGGFHADPVEPVTGAFDPLFRPGTSPAPGQAAGRPGSDAATLNRASPALTPGEDIEFATGMQLPAIDDVIEAAVAGAGAVDTDRLYGRIAIYTLLDAGAEEFDLLAEQVVEQVQTGEPGTLAYVVHGVPSAPLQRILYQLYADRAAYDWHQERPYVADFEARRRPLVLATNVIELGVRQAKVAAVTPRRVP